MKKVKLLIVALSAVGLLASAPAFAADSFSPAEGLYVGIAVGHNAGNVKAKVASSDELTGDSTALTTTTAEITDGGLGLEGIEGGGYIGYGYKMGDTYAGFEIGMTGAGGKFELTTDRAVTIGSGVGSGNKQISITSITAETQWTASGGARIGYYVNDDTLIAFKGGIAVTEFDVSLGGVREESYTAGGPQFGLAVDTRVAAIDPNLSVRLSWDYLDYLTAPISGIGSTTGGSEYNSEITGSAYSARLGVTYSFFDVNSLF